jgi:FKBP-type peptidyl-prolyl cis-trans isomerase FklB
MNKRIIVVALAVLAGATLHSVKAQRLQSRIDTLSYTFGLAQSQGLNRYLDKFNSEVLGNDSTDSLNIDLFLQGFNAGVKGEKGLMSADEANAIVQRLISVYQEQTQMRKYGAIKQAGEDFLKENAKKKDVKTLESGVQYKVLKAGTGPIPTATQKVKVHYEGRTVDGKEFDSSYKRGNPTSFNCNQVIKGWTEALTHMPVGSTWEVYIPYKLAYGERGAGDDIKPYSMLIFKIELLGIED